MMVQLHISLVVFVLGGIGLGCLRDVRNEKAHRVPVVSQSDSNRYRVSSISQQLYMLALGPTEAFTTQNERNALWSVLRGEVPRFASLLGPMEQVPLDYRIEYIFNHTTPDSPEAEFEQVMPWVNRLPKTARKRVEHAQTLLLVKGALERLPNDQETRLTLVALLFLSERYGGVVFDLLNRQALTSEDIRTRLVDPSGLKPQVRMIGASVDGQKGIRSVGLPKYGLFDVFLASTAPRRDAPRLGEIIDRLINGASLPDGVVLEPCKRTRLDFGCYRVSRL